MESKDQQDDHEAMWAVCRKLPSDFEPYGDRSRDEGEDCSSGCRHFVPLSGGLAFDWGVCAHPNSPRAGMLTFEHQGCPEFEPEEGASPQPISESPPLAYDTEDSDESKLRIVPMKWSDLEIGMTETSIVESASYLNRQTGQVAFISDGLESEEGIQERIEQEENDWIEIEPIDSRTGYKIMERFALSQKKAHVKKMLLEALSGPRPFRRFKDVVHSNKELRDEWDQFETEAQREEIEDWLAAYGIKPQWTDLNNQKDI